MAATHSLISSGPKGPKYTFPHLDDDEEPGVMTLRRLQRICEKHDLYRTPEVNDADFSTTARCSAARSRASSSGRCKASCLADAICICLSIGPLGLKHGNLNPY